MLVLPQEYSIPGIGDIIVFYPVFIGNDEENGSTITGLRFGPVDVVGDVVPDITCICPEHPDAIGGIPGKIIIMDVNAVAVVKRHTIILKFHYIVIDFDGPAAEHHHPSSQGRGVISPYINPSAGINLVPGEHIPVDVNMA